METTPIDDPSVLPLEPISKIITPRSGANETECNCSSNANNPSRERKRPVNSYPLAHAQGFDSNSPPLNPANHIEDTARGDGRIEVDLVTTEGMKGSAIASVRPPLSLDLGVRLALGVLALSLGALLGLAAYLTPSPQGFGTHQQLGLPPCTFRWLFKLPCPACGMTTAWSHLMHGNWIGGLHASCSGTYLGTLAIATFPLAAIASVTGRRIGPRWSAHWLVGALCLGMVLAIVEWLIRILT